MRSSPFKFTAFGIAALVASVGAASAQDRVPHSCATDPAAASQRANLLADSQAGSLLAAADPGELKADDQLPNHKLICSAATAAVESLPPVSIHDTPSFSAPSQMPVSNVRLSSAFGMRAHPLLGGRRLHKGVDLAGTVGTPVHATGDGVIGHAGWSGGYGLLVSIHHGAEYETRYGHMSRLAVTPGRRVRKGDVVGYVGSTGRTTGPHLHYEVLKSGSAVDPLRHSVSAKGRRTFQRSFSEVAKKLRATK